MVRVNIGVRLRISFRVEVKVRVRVSFRVSIRVTAPSGTVRCRHFSSSILVTLFLHVW